MAGPFVQINRTFCVDRNESQPPPSHPHVWLCTHTHIGCHVPLQTFPVKVASLTLPKRKSWKVCVCSFFKFLSNVVCLCGSVRVCVHCCISYLIPPNALLVCQTVYGYCEVLFPWKCSVTLDITFSAHFPRNPLSAFNWLRASGDFLPKSHWRP